ncbi:Serine/threonine-protein kinase PknD [Elizabethkingia anophelis]|uniref:protein kinase family protein n=1 Tax=Elizabethkingia anophelis TaxID=1117645 RepID=UPI0024E1BEF3|nr:protein kinase family protein [Elizabethkingia anophelis]CAH1147841.1 Serine/threonine-protein kinase PknD [Elizabethkingia anophelis]CAI9681108.1 Serine/threonine-protein kinase PknD [Elizabethkingia anophelis]
MSQNVIEFLRKKDYKFIRNIGQGGLGKTILLKDEIIDEQFVCKKYDPISDDYKEIYFQNFIDEIKFLHNVYHNNIVRVFNYYLYPDKLTGYILMEFVDGENIKNYLASNPHLISSIFKQVIDGFAHLENNNILHRDIRPENILISNQNTVKIIDFGFGKRINFKEDFDKSISINWRFQPPREFENKIYDFRTEIYFIGKLFEEIIVESGINDFIYKEVINQMTKLDYDSRIENFNLIQRHIISLEDIEIDFTDSEKESYRNFAHNLGVTFSKIESNTVYIKEIEKIYKGLEEVKRNSLLEDYIQNPGAIAEKFVNGNFRYYKKAEFPLHVLSNFIKLINSVSSDKQKIILNNLWQRLDNIERYTIEDDGLPF